jgi:hypothetical protein
MEIDSRIQYAIEHTEFVRPPKQNLATFGVTDIYYYLLTQPVYSEMLDAGREEETVVREGRMVAERPKIVTPYYLLNLFEGFEHGKEYANYLLRHYGSHEPGLLYRYRNHPSGTSILSSPMDSVIHNLNQRIDSEQNTMATIIKGIDELWDVSLMKSIYDLTQRSLTGNVMELGMRGLLDVDSSGVHGQTRQQIEQLFREAIHERAKVSELEAELRRWGLFEEYEDRFLNLFRQR